jgi:hypothetical protein
LYRVDRRSDQRDLGLFVFHGFHLLPYILIHQLAETRLAMV